MNPATRAKLDSLPQRTNYRHPSLWPPGTLQPCTKEFIQYFCDLVSTCDTSLIQLLREHPELPPFKSIDSWRVTNRLGFDDAWRKAKLLQGSYIANKCLELAKNITPKTAHVVRVQFDIYRWFAAKMDPLTYSEKPAALQPNTTVNVGISISPQRLSEIRSKLDYTRKSLLSRSTPKQQDNGAPAAPQIADRSQSPATPNLGK